MKKLLRGLIAAMAAALMIGGAAPAVSVAAAESSDTNVVDAKAAVAIEPTTGKVLYAKNADSVLPIASMTKMLSIELVLDAIDSGKIKWDDKVTLDKTIWSLSQDRDLSNVPLRRDGSYSVRELYDASLIYSANAAMMLLAKTVAGSQEKFVNQMTAKLKSWGITDAKIVNVTGLNNSQLKDAKVPGTGDQAENEMSAKDMAQVAQHLLKDHPEVLKTTSIAKQTFRKGTDDAINMENWDWMLKGLVSYDKNLPVDGLKTGTSDAAGDCFTGTVKKNGMRIITVVLHANGDAKTRRFDQTKKLMNHVLENWKTVQLADAGQGIKGYRNVTVNRGKARTAPIAPVTKAVAVVPSDTSKQDLKYTYTPAKGVKKNTIEAPVKKGATIGHLEVTAKGDSLGFVGGAKREGITLKTTKADPKANFFVLIFRGIGDFFGNIF
ncbi:D-alanyl-D-alanine carboxypeptidase [Lacticaseibacillus zeae]|uniref:serine-type D-Ala-D-Ala carboxypeptidase n=1 Tax=Lacticaseibacillus zeae TaxID=57037 RepID=A0A5R8LN16_LACZE|nr:D-alanyl-D-alanine carboxypeptidase family protein [Lacticaseibacillus zeae]TLF38646.1 D-alanyl-D-alanine carboxypeptidase [Lacticaseibacillus zeae]